MQIQKTISSSVITADFLRQNSAATDRRSGDDKLRPVAETEKTRADKQKQRELLASKINLDELPSLDDVQTLQAVSQKQGFGQFADRRTYAALSAYSVEQNHVRAEEQATLSQILGVDYYV